MTERGPTPQPPPHCGGEGERGRVPLLFGHRGANGEAPENTLSGFRYARSVGMTAFELDVHLSADGELVVIHDATVDRTTNGHGPVAELTAAELAALDARADFSDWPEPCGVPRLAEVLDAFADTTSFQSGAPRSGTSGPVTFQIEIKTDRPERLEVVGRRLVETIGRYGIDGRATVASFDPVALQTMRRIAPEILRAYIGRYDSPSFLEKALELGCLGACIPHTTGSKAMVREAQARGLHVTGWLGNSEEDLKLLLDWRVDSITSDHPSLAIPLLRALTSP